MSYTRKQIEQLKTSFKAKPVLEELLEKFHKGVGLTLAEEEFTCGMMNIMRNERGLYKYDVSNLKGCNNYQFRLTYLKYAHDLEGHGPVRDYYGYISDERKKKDSAFLNDEYQTWEIKINGKKTADPLWNNLIDETLHQIKNLDKYAQRHNPPKARINYFQKSIMLHSKYVYLQVTQFFEDLGRNSIIIDLYGHEILIDSYSFIHTLFRHYAATVKGYQEGKSYHVDQRILYKDLPLFLAQFIRCFSNNCARSSFDTRSINLIYNRKRYTIWFRPLTVLGKKYLRLQTFYPIELKQDRIRTQSLKKLKINSRLTFLIP